MLTFPVASTLCEFAQRACSGTKLDMDTELLGFRAHEAATFADQVDVPGRSGMDTSRESSDAPDVADSEGTIWTE